MVLPVSLGQDADVLKNFVAQPSHVQIVADVLHEFKNQVSLIQSLKFDRDRKTCLNRFRTGLHRFWLVIESSKKLRKRGKQLILGVENYL